MFLGSHFHFRTNYIYNLKQPIEIQDKEVVLKEADRWQAEYIQIGSALYLHFIQETKHGQIVMIT